MDDGWIIPAGLAKGRRLPALCMKLSFICFYPGVVVPERSPQELAGHSHIVLHYAPGRAFWWALIQASVKGRLHKKDLIWDDKPGV